METIRLPRGEWTFDPDRPLGRPGGFGAVFAGTSDAHGELAVKKLHIHASDAAHREMRIAMDLAGRNLVNVVPVLDAGEDAVSGAYFVVMPRAEKSLQDHLDEVHTFDPVEAAGVLLQIVEGLLEVRDIVHRDLKPPNILLHQGQWKIADFGIARFVEEATSLRTLKDCLSPQYAAPEQWQFIRAAPATDVYALGCIGYALLTGEPPFRGSTTDVLRDEHLHKDPPDLADIPPQLRSLLTIMLRKPPESRPSLLRVRQILADLIQRSATPANGPAPAAGFGALAEAGAAVARDLADYDRRQTEVRTEEERRSRLADVGKKVLPEICNELFSRIRLAAPTATEPWRGSSVTLGDGTILVESRDIALLAPNLFPRSGWDVILGSKVSVHQNPRIYQWSSSLWYCKLPSTDEYRWYEVSYFAPLRREPDPFSPYHLTDGPHDADLAAATTIMHLYQVAWGPHPIDDEAVDEFCDRWAALLSFASTGNLRHPSNLPLSRTFWRERFLV